MKGSASFNSRSFSLTSQSNFICHSFWHWYSLFCIVMIHHVYFQLYLHNILQIGFLLIKKKNHLHLITPLSKVPLLTRCTPKVVSELIYSLWLCSYPHRPTEARPISSKSKLLTIVHKRGWQTKTCCPSPAYLLFLYSLWAEWFLHWKKKNYLVPWKLYDIHISLSLDKFYWNTTSLILLHIVSMAEQNSCNRDHLAQKA